jgi:hypothetical protein
MSVFSCSPPPPNPQNTPQVCTARSAGKFVQTAANETTSIMDDTLGLISSLDDRVLPYVNATIEELTAARALLDALKTGAGRIESNVTEIDEYRAWLLAAVDATIADRVPQGELPSVTADQLQVLDDGACRVSSPVCLGCVRRMPSDDPTPLPR